MRLIDCSSNYQGIFLSKGEGRGKLEEFLETRLHMGCKGYECWVKEGGASG